MVPMPFLALVLGMIHCVILPDSRPPEVRRQALQTTVTASGDVLVSQELPPTAYSGSGTYEMFSPMRAFDGDEADWHAYWNAGDVAPQWVEVDLGHPWFVKRVRLVVAQLPDGDTTHEIWASDAPIQGDLSHSVLIGTFNGATRDRQVLELTLETPRSARYVLVLTTRSPSWVAWMEVQVFATPSS